MDISLEQAHSPPQSQPEDTGFAAQELDEGGTTDTLSNSTDENTVDGEGREVAMRMYSAISRVENEMVSAKNFFANALNHITEERKKIAEERNRLTELDRSIGLREAEIKRKLENEQKISAVVEERLRKMGEIVKLNVGGEHFTTSKQTLSSVPNSMLSAMFSGRHDLKLIDGRIFIDRDPRLFRHILAYLRDSEIVLPEESTERRKVLKEFDYYCINPIVPGEAFITHDWKNTQTFGGHTDIVMCLRVIGNGELLSKDKTMALWNLRTGRCLKKYEGHTSSVRHLKVYKETIITASHDKSLKVWDLHTGKIIRSFIGHEEYVMCFKVLKSENLLFSGAHDRTVKVWDLTTGEEKHSFTAHLSGVSCIKVIGDTLYTGSDDKTIKVWDRRRWQCLQTLEGHNLYVMSLQVKGQYLYSGSWDKTIKIWDLKTGKCVRTLEGHTQGVYAIKVVGDVIVSCSGDNTIKIWDANTGTCHKTLEGHKRHVMALKVKGNTIYSGSSDKTIKVWECLID